MAVQQGNTTEILGRGSQTGREERVRVPGRYSAKDAPEGRTAGRVREPAECLWGEFQPGDFRCHALSVLAKIFKAH